MDLNKDALHIAEAIKTLPPDTIITWSDDALQMSPVARRASWIDVYSPLLCEDLHLNWLWTIVTPGDEDADYSWPSEVSSTIALPPDCLIHTTTDPAQGWFSYDGECFVTPIDGELTVEQTEILNARAQAVDGEVVALPAWRKDTINATLLAWCTSVAGRSDLIFTDDEEATSPMFKAILEMKEDITSGIVETYDIGDGVTVSSGFMDDLLSMDSDDSAKITGDLKKLLKEIDPE